MFEWKKIILVWNRWFKNLWDELILIGLMKILLKENKQLFIACTNKKWLKGFHKQFFVNNWFYDFKEEIDWFSKDGKQIITYIQELPKWFRSGLNFLKNFKDIKFWLKADSLIIWWWEILTEETPFSYWYWLASSFLGLAKNLYLMWWIQKPKKLRNLLPFWILTSRAKKILYRDKEFLWRKWKDTFFFDTSEYAVDWKIKIDTQKHKWLIDKDKKNKTLVVNINRKAEKFYKQIEEIIEGYYKKDWTIKFAWICKSEADNDIIYYNKLKEKYHSIQLLDWENDFWTFLNKLSEAGKVYTTRLHLFLISYYLDLDVESFVYEKKVAKLKKVLQED